MADHYSIHLLSLVGVVQIVLEKRRGGGESVHRRDERAGDSGKFILSVRLA